MESNVMDSLHQKPRDVCDATFCDTEEAMGAEGSLHQKSNEVCLTEDAESIDLGWFEDTKLNRVKNGARCLLQVGLRDWESLGTFPLRIQKGLAKQWQKSLMPKWKDKVEFIFQKKATSGGTSRYTRSARGRAAESRF